jgi:hypothetical protein
LELAVSRFSIIKKISKVRESKKILNSCLKRWQYEDERTRYFSQIFDEWISKIPDDAIKMVYYLLSCFCYYPHDNVNKLLVKLHKRLLMRGSINDNNTIYLMIKSKIGIGNSSNDYWSEYKYQNKLNKYTFIDNINFLEDRQLEYIQNVVFIDDCSGSGGTFIKYINNNIDIFRNKNIYFITIHIMKQAVDSIKNYSKENKLKISIITNICQDKAFNLRYFKNNEYLKTLLIDLSRSFKINNNYILGYDDTEGLFAFFNNSPNNTLGLFWHDTATYRSPFPRKFDSKPVWMKYEEEKKKREAQNYLVKSDKV